MLEVQQNENRDDSEEKEKRHDEIKGLVRKED